MIADLTKNLVLLAAFLLGVTSASAQCAAADTATEYEHPGISFKSYRPTQFLRMTQSSSIMPDYDHFQMNLSPEFRGIINESWSWGAVYNCEYSFYMDKLYSGPVLSRLQNPFLYLEWHFGRDQNILRSNHKEVKEKRSRIGLTVAHESNGMILDDSLTYRSFTRSGSKVGAEEGYLHNYNSMGWNYFALHFRTRLRHSFRCLFDKGEISLEYRLYTNQSFGFGKEKFWDLENHHFLDRGTTSLPQANYDKITIRNYDGLRFFVYQERYLRRKKGCTRATQKIRFFYELISGLPVGGDWGSANVCKQTHKFETAFGWLWNEGWGSLYFVAGHDDGFRKYLSSYPCYRSLWYLGIQMAF